MANEYIYYEDIHESGEVLDLKLREAREYYNSVDKTCRIIEQKAQQAVVTTLVTLGIILGFITFSLKEVIQFEQPYLILSSIVLFSVILFTTLAIFHALETFKLKTKYLVGKNDIMESNYDYKKVLIAKYLNYACSNEKSSRAKRDSLKSVFKHSKATLGSLLLYAFLVFCYLNFNNWILLFILAIAVLAVIPFVITYREIAQRDKKAKQRYKEVEQERDAKYVHKQVQKEAYYNSLKYPENTELENWLMAEKSIYQ